MKSKRTATRGKKIAAASSLAPRLAAYSATAAAALAFTPNAQAQVMPITTFSYPGHPNTTTPPSFALQASQTSTSFRAGPFSLVFSGLVGRVRLQSPGNSNSDVFAVHGASVLKLTPGSAIKPHPFGFDQILASRNSANPTGKGDFVPGPNGAVTGYIGVRGTNAGHTYYGWLRLRVTGDANGDPNSVSFVAKNGNPGIFGAYEDVTSPNIGTFSAGDVPAIPEPADAAFGLGLLAFGAAGVRELRRRRKVAA